MARPRKAESSREKTPGVKVPRIRRTGDLDALRARHWAAIATAYRLMKAPGASFQEQLSAIHALNQSSGSYVKLLEATDITNELAKMRSELSELRQTDTLRKVA